MPFTPEYTNPCKPHGFNDCCNVPEPVFEVSECLDYRGSLTRCSGKIEYRMPLSGSGRAFPRCDLHWGERLDIQETIDRRYPDSPIPPSDFDPYYAGESWDEDY